MFKLNRVGGNPSFRGVRPLVVFVLCFTILCSSFNCYAFNTTNSQTVGNFECPDTAELYTQFSQLQFDIFLFFDPNNNDYYLVGIKDMWTNTQQYQCLYNPSTQNLFRQWSNYYGDYHFGWGQTNYAKVYHWSNLMEEYRWYESSLTYDFNSTAYFATSDYLLIACEMYNPCYAQGGEEIIVYGYNPHNVNGNYLCDTGFITMSTKLSFDENGHLSNYSINANNSDKTSGWFAKLKTWLTSLGDRIGNFFSSLSTSISGFISSAVTSISGFFTNLWNNVSSAFSSLWSNISSFFIDKFTSLYNWFVSLGDRIHTFFVTLVDNIKGLFVPSNDFFTNYWNTWNTWLHAHLGGLFDSYDLINTLTDDLYSYFNDYPDYTECYIHIPNINMNLSVSGAGNKRIINARDVNLYQFFTFNENTHLVRLYSFYRIIANITIVLGGIYLIRMKLIKLFEITTDEVEA